MSGSQNAQTHRYTLGYWYVRVDAHMCSTLCTGNQIKTQAQPSIWADTCTHTLSSRGTCSTTHAQLSTQETQRKIHAELSKPANRQGTWRQHMLSKAGTCWPVDTWNWMKIHIQLWKHANKCSALELQADKCIQPMSADTHSSSGRSKEMQNTLISWYEQTRSQTSQVLGYVRTHAGFQCVSCTFIKWLPHLKHAE